MRKLLTKKQDEQVSRLWAKADFEIDFSDIPKMVGALYKRIKRPIAIRIDADVLALLKSPPGYQTRLNKLWRDAMNVQKGTSYIDGTSANDSRTVARSG